MDGFDLQRYLKGKKDFWIYVILTACFLGLGYYISGIDISFLWAHALILFLLYQGYVWVWYFDAVRTAYNFIQMVIILADTIPELYWMIYAYTPMKLIASGLGYTIIAASVILVIVRKNLRYFVKMNQLKRKGKLDDQILQKIKNTKK